MSPEDASHSAAVPATASACPGYAPGIWPPVISPVCSDSVNNRHTECTLPGCTCACHNPPAR